MCKNCKASELGQTRQAELDAARQALIDLNINPDVAGFIFKYATSRVVPKDEAPGTQEAVERYNAAKQAMKTLHDDYIFERGRQALVERSSEATLKGKLKELHALPQGSLSPEQVDLRNKIENRLWALHVEKHPPIHTPANFIEQDEEW